MILQTVFVRGPKGGIVRYRHRNANGQCDNAPSPLLPYGAGAAKNFRLVVETAGRRATS